MSLLADSAVGIDVSDGVLKAVRLARRGRRIALRQTWRVPYFGDPDPEVGAREALDRFQRGARLGTHPRIVLSAPDRGHFSRTYVVPAMEADRVGELVRYEVLNELDLPPEDVLVRYHVRKGVVEQQVHSYALRPGEVDDFVARLRELRIPFDDLEMPGFALASFVEHEIPAARDRIVLGVGELATHLVLLTEDGIHTRHLPLGLQHAEDPVQLARRLADEIGSAVEYFLPGDREFKPSDAVLTEEGAVSAAFTGALKRALKLPVTRFGELRRIATSRRVHLGDHAPELALSMGKAYGLALSGLQLGRFRCPVLEGNPQRDAARRVPVAAGTLALAAAGLAGITHLAWQRVDALDAALPQGLDSEVASLVTQTERVRLDLGEQRSAAEALLALARRRGATFEVRTTLSRVAQLAETRGERVLHVDNVWLAPGQPGRPGLMTATIHASPEFDDTLRERLVGAFVGGASPVRVLGPEPAPDPGVSRWVVEMDLP